MSYNFDLEMDTENSLTKIIQQISPYSKVLEFGPANGRLTRYLKETLNCKVYIVELDADAAKDAMKYAEDGIIGNIEELFWLEQWEKITFDYIIFADVLEHLRNPELVLKQTKLLLKEDGKVLISVPNVAHNSVMINLYNNIFEYTPVGLLDHTHLHLFAYNTLKEFCHYGGFVAILEDAVYSRVGTNEVKASYEQVPCSFAGILKKRNFSNVYQFVFTLQKKDFVEKHETVLKKNILLTLPEYHVKVYTDYGNGWTEENCIDYSIRLEKRFTAEIPLDSSISALRIDPLDANVLIRIHQLAIKIDGKLQSFNSESMKHTGYKCNNLLFNSSDDPQIVIDNLELADNSTLLIDFEYLLYDENPELFKMLEACQILLDQKQEELEVAHREIIEQHNECKLLQEISEQNSSLQSSINLYSSENLTLTNEIEKLRCILNGKNMEIDIFQKSNATLENKKQVLQCEIDKLKDNISKLELHISLISNEKQTLEVEYENYKQTKSMFKKVLKFLKKFKSNKIY